MQRKGRTEVKGWMDDLDNAMLQALADGNHGELRRIIDELEQMIAAARSNLEEIERGGKAAGRKGILGDLWSWLTRAGPSADEAFVRRQLEGHYADVEDQAALSDLIDLFIDEHARWQDAVNNDDEAGRSRSEFEMGRLRGQMDDLQMGKSAKGKGAKGDVIYGRFGSSDDGDEGGSEATESDVDEFLADAVEPDDGASVTVEELEAAFAEWASGRGLGALDHTVFMRAIDRAGYRSGRIAGANRVIGVRRKSARRPAGKARPTSAHRLYA